MTTFWRQFDWVCTLGIYIPHVHIFVKMSSNWRYLVASINGQNKVENVRLFFGYFWPWKANNWRWKSVEKSSNWPWILTSENSWKIVKLTLNTDVKKQLKRVEILTDFFCEKNASMWIRSPYSPYPWFVVLWLYPLCHEDLLNRWI